MRSPRSTGSLVTLTTAIGVPPAFGTRQEPISLGRVEPVPGFRQFETLHCVTGSMRHIYDFHGHPISEELLLGLGAGVGFVYWHMKGQMPFLGGRANVGRPGEPGLVRLAAGRTGVAVDESHTSSTRKATTALTNNLDTNQPLMVGVDMGFLPYFDFGGEYHFGGHVIVACGLKQDRVLVADRDHDLHEIPLEALEQARGSTFKPFPPRNIWWTWDFTSVRSPTVDQTWTAIAEATSGMLEAPIANLGVRGIGTAAKRVRAWPESVPADLLSRSCFESFIFIDATGGTGGGLFRYMYGRFLIEAASITGEGRLAEIGARFKDLGDAWQVVAEAFRAPDAAQNLSEISALIAGIEPQEREVWESLRAALPC